ncbi:MAG: hypothetical protein KDG55_08580 [Rhodocyclaceae bacterium]|nr:hypothetical protein [Rhodocyclaceae bacterium]
MSPDFSMLDAAGMNLQAILDLDALAPGLRERVLAELDPGPWRRILVLANAGPRLWRTVREAGVPGPDPIDDFSRALFARWWRAQGTGARHQVLFPGATRVDLQALGRLAGWHHSSPLMIGIHPHWGTWFGYRVVVVTDVDWDATAAETGPSPCASCPDRPCQSACPAAAVGPAAFDLKACLRFRAAPASPCALSCAARMACPAGAAHRYDEDQIRHSYGDSLRAIQRFGLG